MSANAKRRPVARGGVRNGVDHPGRLIDSSNSQSTSDSQAFRREAQLKESRLNKRRSGSAPLTVIRDAELRRVITYRGGTLPDDEAGREGLFVALHVRAPKGEGELDLRRYAQRIAPWIEPEEATRLINRVYARPLKYSADTVARALQLLDSDRTRLGITTIGSVDVPKADRLARRKARKVAQRRAQRRAKGAVPRAQWEAKSYAQTKPWLAFGWSRATWYRRGKPSPETVGTPSILILQSMGSELSQGPSKGRHAQERAPTAALALLGRGTDRLRKRTTMKEVECGHD